MSLRRSKLDIVLSVLSAVRDGVDKPTRIMYAANLSWRPTQKILESLVQQGLLTEADNPESKRSKKRYDITEKGANVLRYFDGASALIDLEEVISQD
jgi:predicted transcriptional regulator